MKKILMLTGLLAAGLILCCSVKTDNSVNPYASDFEKYCSWIDENTLEITAAGTADEKYEGKSEIIKENAACSAAKIKAMTIAAYVLKGENSSELSVLIKGGKTVSRTYSPAGSTCTTVYRISRKNLSALKRPDTESPEPEADPVQESEQEDEHGTEE